MRESGNVFEIAHAQLGIMCPEACVEVRIARRGVMPVLLEGPIKIEDATGR